MGSVSTFKDYDVAGSSSSSAEILYKWSLLLLGSGAVCMGSSDGSTFDNAGGNKWISATAINNTNHAWFRASLPDGRELIVQYDKASAGIRIKTSKTGFVTGATATKTPSATDQKLLTNAQRTGGDTDASPVFSPNLLDSATMRLQGYCDLRNNTSLAFYIVGYDKTSKSVQFVWFFEYAQNTESGETDPWVSYVSGAGATSPMSALELGDDGTFGNGNEVPIGYPLAGLSGDVGSLPVQAMKPINSIGNDIFTNPSSSLRSGKANSIEVTYMCPNIGNALYRGTSALFRWAPQRKTIPNNATAHVAGDRQYFNEALFIWDPAVGAWS